MPYVVLELNDQLFSHHIPIKKQNCLHAVVEFTVFYALCELYVIRNLKKFQDAEDTQS